MKINPYDPDSKDKVEKRLHLYFNVELKHVEIEFQDEPLYMRLFRVDEILDMSPSTRNRLIASGDLIKVKMGNNVQSASRITKESLIRYITKLKVERLSDLENMVSDKW